MASLTADILLVQFINGLFIAAGIYLVASGLSLVFGVLGVLNFAHGSFYMYGAFFVFTWIGFKLGGFWPALLIAPFAVVIVGVATEIVFLRPIYKADPLYQLLLTYGLVLMFGDLVKLIWGADNQSVARPPGFEGTIAIFGAQFLSYQMFVLIPIGIATILGLYLLLNHTQIGNVVRAATQDREMVGALGINVRLLYTGVFAIGAFLGGLGGAVLAPMGALYPGMDFDVIIEVFLVVVLGGLGSMAGTALGALIYGELKSLGILLVPDLESVFIYVLMVIVLLTRPQGLLGKRLETSR
ncbi:branched-chain amino acid ABC transporter permease [Reyranella sp.]|uniref:branched-chain amino acid ABC transporter permease n=1 Tax=Reyranella sp. TaxID=1929291 RepID=UPI00378476E0